MYNLALLTFRGEKKKMNLFECIPRVTEITELDVQRQKIDMVEVKQMKTAPIVLSFHMKFFYSYKMASYILSQKSSLFLVLCKTPRRSYMNCTPICSIY